MLTPRFGLAVTLATATAVLSSWLSEHSPTPLSPERLAVVARRSAAQSGAAQHTPRPGFALRHEPERARTGFAVAWAEDRTEAPRHGPVPRIKVRANGLQPSQIDGGTRAIIIISQIGA